MGMYREIDGIKIPVTHKIKGSDHLLSCPFCGEQHMVGRAANGKVKVSCKEGEGFKSYYTDGGYQFHADNGVYVIDADLENVRFLERDHIMYVNTADVFNIFSKHDVMPAPLFDVTLVWNEYFFRNIFKDYASTKGDYFNHFLFLGTYNHLYINIHCMELFIMFFKKIDILDSKFWDVVISSVCDHLSHKNRKIDLNPDPFKMQPKQYYPFFIKDIKKYKFYFLTDNLFYLPTNYIHSRVAV